MKGIKRMSKLVTSKEATLINAKQLAEMLSISERHLWRMRAAGKLPKTVKIGSCVRWLLSDIEMFLNMGCPSQKQFESMTQAGKRGGK